MADGAVSWRSKQQALHATSITEAETIAASDATKEARLLRKLCVDLKIPQLSSTTLYEANTACISITNDPTFHGRTKHSAVHDLFVRERAAVDDIRLEYCPTDDMTADVLTKRLGKAKSEKHRAAFGMISLSSWTGGSVAARPWPDSSSNPVLA